MNEDAAELTLVTLFLEVAQMKAMVLAIAAAAKVDQAMFEAKFKLTVEPFYREAFEKMRAHHISEKAIKRAEDQIIPQFPTPPRLLS